MPRFFLPLTALLGRALTGRAQAPGPAEWQNPQLTQQGQEAPRASFELYERPADVRAGDAARSSWYQRTAMQNSYSYPLRLLDGEAAPARQSLPATSSAAHE